MEVYTPFTYKDLFSIKDAGDIFDQYIDLKENQDINFGRLNIDDKTELLPDESQISSEQ